MRLEVSNMIALVFYTKVTVSIAYTAIDKWVYICISN